MNKNFLLQFCCVLGLSLGFNLSMVQEVQAKSEAGARVTDENIRIDGDEGVSQSFTKVPKTQKRTKGEVTNSSLLFTRGCSAVNMYSASYDRGSNIYSTEFENLNLDFAIETLTAENDCHCQGHRRGDYYYEFESSNTLRTTMCISAVQSITWATTRSDGSYTEHTCDGVIGSRNTIQEDITNNYGRVPSSPRDGTVCWWGPDTGNTTTIFGLLSFRLGEEFYQECIGGETERFESGFSCQIDIKQEDGTTETKSCSDCGVVGTCKMDGSGYEATHYYFSQCTSVSESEVDDNETETRDGD